MHADNAVLWYLESVIGETDDKKGRRRRCANLRDSKAVAGNDC